MNKNLKIKDLNIEHLADVLRLQDKIIAGFNEDEKHFILKRSVEDFIKALDSENINMIGVFDGDKLVAQSIFEFPQDNQKRDLEELWKYIDVALIIMLFIFAVFMEVVKAFFRKCSSSIKSKG